MELNEKQQQGVDEGTKWFNIRRQNPSDTSTRPLFEISGGAGTGKTTVIKHLISKTGIDLSKFLFMAYTGKATLALRLSGLKAQTICASIYDIIKVPAFEDTGIVMKNGKPVMKSQFKLKDKIPSDIEGLVVDEAGMVNIPMGRDILSFKVPVFAMGDLNQLPPIFGESYFLQNPDIILNKIMRQKEGSAIIYLSRLALYGMPIPYGSYGINDECIVIPKKDLTDNHLKMADMILCKSNETRDMINTYTRKYVYGITSKNIEIGDKMVCRQNHWDITLKSDNNIALVNGLVGYITNIYLENNNGNTIEVDFKPEFTDEAFHRIPVENRYPFLPYNKRKSLNSLYLNGAIFEFGYSITVHLSQGSQSDTVLVYVEKLSESLVSRQWLYTAITRAKKKLILVI